MLAVTMLIFQLRSNHFICEKQGIKLQRYDLNEPKRGKDQCDREAAAAKNLKNSYVDAGKDVQDAEDVYNAFQYAGGLKNSKVCVAEIDTLLTKIDCEKTKDISKYHSFEF